jgi:hypothetical protein
LTVPCVNSHFRTQRLKWLTLLERPKRIATQHSVGTFLPRPQEAPALIVSGIAVTVLSPK